MRGFLKKGNYFRNYEISIELFNETIIDKFDVLHKIWNSYLKI